MYRSIYNGFFQAWNESNVTSDIHACILYTGCMHIIQIGILVFKLFAIIKRTDSNCIIMPSFLCVVSRGHWLIKGTWSQICLSEVNECPLLYSMFWVRLSVHQDSVRNYRATTLWCSLPNYFFYFWYDMLTFCEVWEVGNRVRVCLVRKRTLVSNSVGVRQQSKDRILCPVTTLNNAECYDYSNPTKTNKGTSMCIFQCTVRMNVFVVLLLTAFVVSWKVWYP